MAEDPKGDRQAELEQALEASRERLRDTERRAEEQIEQAERLGERIFRSEMVPQLLCSVILAAPDHLSAHLCAGRGAMAWRGVS